MLSRVADNLYWFGRYVQRAENTARLISVNANLLLDLPRRVTLGWGPLIAIVGADAQFNSLYDQATEDNVVRFLTVDERNPGSIKSSLNSAREILRVSRDTVPRDVWERLNDLYLFTAEHGDREIARAQRMNFLSEVVNGCVLVYGVLMTTMSHDVGYLFMRIGASLEQADMTTRILDVRSVPLLRDGSAVLPFANIQWVSVLRSLTAYQMYRRHVRERVSGARVLRFLLQNREFPRSVMFCLSSIAETMPRLPQKRGIERAMERTRALVRDANLEALLATEGALPQFIDEIQIGLGDVHNALAEAYFSERAHLAA
jgi:uncharacterized alpha-E superfamily protein